MYQHQVLNAFSRLKELPGNGFTLIAHASYLFKTGGVLWAVDPAHQEYDLPPLPGLAFALVTHEHGDHYQPRSLSALAGAGSRIVAPPFLPGIEVVPGAEYIRPGERATLFGHAIRAFPGSHYDAGTTVGVPEVCYWVDAPSLSIALPGDVRDYSFPYPLRRPDWLMAHVWLGRGNALNPPCEPWRSQAAAFFRGIGAKHTLLAHLNDLTRAPEDRWTEAHAALLIPDIPHSFTALPFEIVEM